MAEIIWAERSILDLEDIYYYIARDSHLYAQYTVQNIFKAAERLREFPDSGHHLPELPDMPHREIISGNYRMIYRYDEAKESIIIITVLHGSRLLKESFLEE